MNQRGELYDSTEWAQYNTASFITNTAKSQYFLANNLKYGQKMAVF